MQRLSASALGNALPWALLFGFAATLTLQDIRSLDYWWMLRTGQLIAETGAVPRADVYTYTVPGARWVDIHWLFQVGLYGLYRLGGHAAVVVGKFALLAAMLALLAPIGYRRQRPFLSVAALTLLLVASCGRFTPRPELVSFVVLAAELLLLDRFERRGDAWVYAIVPLQVFWANVHGLFALGIALCAMHLAGELARPLGAPGSSVRWQRLRRLAVVTALAACASFVNPNGLDGALYPLQQLDMVGSAEQRDFFGRIISELQPPLGSMTPLNLVLFLAVAGLSLGAIALNWRSLPLSDPLTWIAFFYLAMGAKRNVAIFNIVAIPMLVRNLNAVLETRSLPRAPPRWGGAVVSLILALLGVAALRGDFYLGLGVYRSPGLGVIEDFNPTGAVDWLERNRPPGSIAHNMTDGGYLIWRLYPDYPVMSDGRLEVFGPEVFEKLLLANPERFAALDAEYQFGSVLASYNRLTYDELLGWWHQHPDWRLTYVDEVAAVFVRVPPEGTLPYPELDIEAPDLFRSADGSRGWLDELGFRSRIRFYAALGRYDLASASWDQALEFFPFAKNGQLIRAMLRERLEASQAPD
jgi:hypothetical protein